MSSKRLRSSVSGAGWLKDAFASGFRTTGASVGAGTMNVVGDGDGDDEVSAIGEAGPDGDGAADGCAHAAVNATSRVIPNDAARSRDRVAMGLIGCGTSPPEATLATPAGD